MRTYSAEPNTLEEIQTTIEHWFDASYTDQAKPPCTVTRKSDESRLNVFIAHSAHCDLKVEMLERCLFFQVKHTRLNLNLEKFSVYSAYEREKLCLRIEPDPELEHRVLVSSLKQFSKTKHPAFCARMLRAVKGLETDLTATLIDEATAAPTDQLVMFEALSSAPWASELAAQDPIVASKLRGFELRQEMLKKSGGVFSSRRVAELLNVSRQAVDKRRAANQLLALTQGRRGYSYPTFQFEDGKTLNGLEEVLRNLRALDPWMQIRFFTSPHERLGNETPMEALRSGKVNDVVRAASGYGEQGAI
ncbi:MAG: hypothetical protein ACLQVL_32730 [Terriglobia bacterium]